MFWKAARGGGVASYLGREMWSRSLPYQGVLPKTGLGVWGGWGLRIGRAQSSTALSGSARSELEFLLQEVLYVVIWLEGGDWRTHLGLGFCDFVSVLLT